MRKNPFDKSKVYFTFCFNRATIKVKLTLHFRGALNMKNRIPELRKQLGYTQQVMAEKLNVSRQTIISLENEKYNPSILLAYQIAKLFDKTIEEVFIFEEE